MCLTWARQRYRSAWLRVPGSGPRVVAYVAGNMTAMSVGGMPSVELDRPVAPTAQQHQSTAAKAEFDVEFAWRSDGEIALLPVHLCGFLILPGSALISG